MPHHAKDKKNRHRPADDIMHGLRELAKAIEDGAPLRERFTVRTVSIPEPGKYSPTAVRKLRSELGMSQALFAQLLGVSRVWVQGWERGVRQPSPLARRLMDTIGSNPASWLESVWAKAS
jgi:DNA-binding transcriptional regulator YiaG